MTLLAFDSVNPALAIFSDIAKAGRGCEQSRGFQLQATWRLQTKGTFEPLGEPVYFTVSCWGPSQRVSARWHVRPCGPQSISSGSKRILLQVQGEDIWNRKANHINQRMVKRSLAANQQPWMNSGPLTTGVFKQSTIKKICDQFRLFFEETWGVPFQKDLSLARLITSVAMPSYPLQGDPFTMKLVELQYHLRQNGMDSRGLIEDLKRRVFDAGLVHWSLGWV